MEFINDDEMEPISDEQWKALEWMFTKRWARVGSNLINRRTGKVEGHILGPIYIDVKKIIKDE